MKHLRYIVAVALTVSLHSCDLIRPADTVNPNVDENTFLHSSHAMSTWVTGVEKSFATVIGNFCLQTEIISDDYYNNYTRENKVFDIPELDYTDPDIESLQRGIANVRESADYGIDKVRPNDSNTSDSDLFKLYYMKGYVYLLAGENFRVLPMTTGGETAEAKVHLTKGLEILDKALTYAASADDKAFIHTLKARACYSLGRQTDAANEAKASLALSPQLIKQVTYDGVNGVGNAMQDVIWKTMLQPLPRLDFLDPKYFQLTATEERPICIAKAEENMLILAEAALAGNRMDEAKAVLGQLVDLVQSRPMQQDLNDQLEGRYNGGFKRYPNESSYTVAASAEDDFRAGLILDRAAPHLIQIPYISGTSVTKEMIGNATTVDALLETVYLMRQEIFIAEGRRMSDLGIRLPVCEVEAAHTASAADFTKALIPPFIPLDRGMDAFTIDDSKKQVTIQYNMNKIIVRNKATDYVVPFF